MNLYISIKLNSGGYNTADLIRGSSRQLEHEEGDLKSHLYFRNMGCNSNSQRPKHAAYEDG